MKRFMLAAMIAGVAVAFTGCKKKAQSPSGTLNSAVDQGKGAADKAAADADQTDKDLNTKLENALKK